MSRFIVLIWGFKCLKVDWIKDSSLIHGSLGASFPYKNVVLVSISSSIKFEYNLWVFNSFCSLWTLELIRFYSLWRSKLINQLGGLIVAFLYQGSYLYIDNGSRFPPNTIQQPKERSGKTCSNLSRVGSHHLVSEQVLLLHIFSFCLISIFWITWVLRHILVAGLVTSCQGSY